MMITELDTGRRCEAHVGEVFPPRCSACGPEEERREGDEREATNLAALLTRTGFLPGSECPQHKNYPLPCDRCKRDRAVLAEDS
jgi:hypothetical protein